MDAKGEHPLRIGALLFAAAGMFGPGPLAAAENAAAIGRAEGVPGETVRVPVRVTSDAALFSAFIALSYDPEVLTLLAPTISGTVSESLPVATFSYGKVRDGAATVLLLSQMRFGGFGVERFYPPGEDMLILWLRFRIRSSAPAGGTAVRHAPDTIPEGGNNSTRLTTIQGDSLRAAYLDGAVTVRPPAGFRPPEILSCAQVVARVALSWENLDAYDKIDIERDGAPIATLPAGTTGWTDPSPPRGLRVYRLIATKGGAHSVGVECEIEVGPPVVPSPGAFTCAPRDGAVALSWTRGTSYDRIRVMRDRMEIAVLPGDASSYIDADVPDSPTLYEVVGVLEGYASPAARCVFGRDGGGPPILRAVDVRAEPGERGVRVPIHVTNTEPIMGCQICVIAPEEGLIAGAGYTFDGSLTDAIGYDMVLADNEGDRVRVALLYDAFPPYDRIDFPPAVDSPIFSVLIDVPASASHGDVIPLTFGTCGRPGQSQIETVLTIGGESVVPDSIPGGVWVGDTGVEAVCDLVAEPIGKAKGPVGVRIAWRNADPYDRIAIERNGRLAAELPGDSTSFVDALEPNRVYPYRITAFLGGRSSFPASIIVHTFPKNFLFRRGDANGDGRVNIADPVSLLGYLYALGRAPACADAADADDTGHLDLADPIYILSFLFAGGPAPPLPGPRFDGFDPTPDELQCP